MLNERRCWRANKTCQYGKIFLRQLYSWSEDNPLHPMLVLKVCDPCYYDGVAVERTVLINDGELKLLSRAEHIEQFYLRMNMHYPKYELSLGCT